MPHLILRLHRAASPRLVCHGLVSLLTANIPISGTVTLKKTSLLPREASSRSADNGASADVAAVVDESQRTGDNRLCASVQLPVYPAERPQTGAEFAGWRS